MSHTVKVKLNLKDRELIKAVAKKLGIEFMEAAQRGDISGCGIKLPKWQYPVVISATGECAYDNYNGNWGNIEELNKFQAHYGAEKTRIEAARMGYEVTEYFNAETNDIELTVNVGE